MLHRQLTEITLSKTNNALRVPMQWEIWFRSARFEFKPDLMRLGSDWLSSAEGVRKPLQDLPDAELRPKRDGRPMHDLETCLPLDAKLCVVDLH